MTPIFRECGPWLWLVVTDSFLAGAALIVFLDMLVERSRLGAACAALICILNVGLLWSALRHPPNTSIVHVECEKCHPDDGRVQIRVGPKVGGDQPQALRPKLT